MGNSISTEEDDEKRSQSTAADTEAEENAAKLVRDIEDTYQTASDFYGNLLCCLCMFNNLCCLTWMLSIGVLCFLVFLTFGIVFLITDADECGTTSSKWGFCVASLCIYTVSLYCGSYNPPLGHLLIAIVFLVVGTVVMFGPDQACTGSSLHTWFTLHYIGLYFATAFFSYMIYLNADSYGTNWIPQKYVDVIQTANQVINGSVDENKTLIDTGGQGEGETVDIERGEKESSNKSVSFSASTKVHDGTPSKEIGVCAQS